MIMVMHVFFFSKIFICVCFFLFHFLLPSVCLSLSVCQSSVCVRLSVSVLLSVCRRLSVCVFVPECVSVRVPATEEEEDRGSQKLQSLQDKQRNHLKNACECEEEMQMLSKEMEERKAIFETRVRALSEQSGDSRKAADDLEVEIQALQAGGERRGSCASQSSGCCFDPAMLEHFLAVGATQALQQLDFDHGEMSPELQSRSGAGSSGRREGSLGRRLG